MIKIPIAIYLQHYLAPSMTFIYRQLKKSEQRYNPVVICSDRTENLEKFPFENLYLKKRNFINIKKSRYYNRLFGSHSLLSVNPRISIHQTKYFLELLKGFDIKLIHAHFGPSGLEILNLSKKYSVPLLVTFHGYDASLLLKMKKYLRNLEKLFEYAYIITVSEIMKEELVELGCAREKIFVIRCGIPINSFKYYERNSLKNKFQSGETITFLQISNFVEKKGHCYTIQAFQKFLHSYQNAKLLLAGDGFLKETIKNKCEQLGIINNTKFLGLVNEEQVRKLMMDADVFVHHSVTSKNGDKEGIPTVIMEAMASGLPVISTYHSGIPELIDNEINGFLVNEKDVNALATSMLNLKNVSSTIGLNAREKVKEKFNLDVETEKMFNIYDKLISSNN